MLNRHLSPLLLLITACSSVRAETGSTPETEPTPEINQRFMTADPDELGFLESEGREVYVHRDEVVDALDIEPGDHVADVGAGTGAYLEVLANAVGPEGKLYAVDVAPKLVEHLRQRARTLELEQVEAVLATQASVNLPKGSIDLVFTSDTYHHFEDPAATNASIHAALKPGGHYVVLDFERIAEESRDWILEHVRAGKTTVIDEITEAGFTLKDELEIDGLKENYLLVFEKK
jgi:predicted methyltransferase